MAKLFIGKFTKKDQYDGNYHQHDGENYEAYFNGLKEGDYVLPSHGGYFGKLYKLRTFEKKEVGVIARFDIVKTFTPDLTMTANIVCCKYFKPDINLLNKIIKSTKGLGFFEIELEDSSPNIEDIDFTKSQRRFLIVLEEMLTNINFFKPSDICVVIDNIESASIIDIFEFNGQLFNRQNSLWSLYQEKIEYGNKKYDLSQLLDYASPKKDDAPNKYKYLKAVLATLKEDKYFVVDNAIALYDNILVGRKQYSPKPSGNSTTPVDTTEGKDEGEIEDLTLYEQYAKILEFNPNIILYGPPGTGKTYGAMRIIEAFESMRGNPSSFKSINDEGRARFITFHQAFSYEEFVEGLRPETDENGDIKYEVKPGILRRIAEDCRIEEVKKNIKDDVLANTTSTSKVWKVSLGRRNKEEHIFKYFKNSEEIAINNSPKENVVDWEDKDIDVVDKSGMVKALSSKMEIGDIIFVFDSVRTIRLIGVVTSDYYYSTIGQKEYCHRRKVKWIKDCEDDPIDIFRLNNKKQLALSSLYELQISSLDALNLIKLEDGEETLFKPFYLIIDEINRGNIAKIFGELITLIEKDKRDKISCILPYSGIEFTLPNNLYIIGTMNTSDRSIALLDTALRRRFAFIEVTPDTNLIESRVPMIGGNVSPAKLLNAINEKIVEKIDRDHRIGHSYFLGDDLITKVDLFYVWYYKILPLLMEYFYNDISQVADIVGERFFDKKKGEIIMLSLKSNDLGVSDFESALMNIYERGN